MQKDQPSLRARPVCREIFQILQNEIATHRQILGEPKVAKPKASVQVKPAGNVKPKVQAKAKVKKPKVKAKKGSTTFFEKFVESGKFLFTSSLIFGLLFAVMNFSAFWQLAQARLFPHQTFSRQVALENLIANQVPQESEPLAASLFAQEQSSGFSFSIAPLGNHIVIPKIGRSVPIVKVSQIPLLLENWGKLESEIQDALKSGAVHYPGTALPGEIGNVFITGHSSFYPWAQSDFGDAFALLHDLQVGDRFAIFWNQKKFEYRIRQIKVVPPEDTSVLAQPADGKIATLMTCTPIGTTKNRLILVADQV